MNKHIAIAFGLIISLSLCIAPNGHSKPSLQDYAKSRLVSMMSVSPDGKYVAFRKQENTKSLLVVYAIAERKFVTGLDISEVDPWRIYFLDQNKIVLVASKEMRLHGYRGTHDISSAFVFNIKDNSLNQLLKPGDNIYVGQTGLGGIVGVHDHYVYMPAYVGESKLDNSPDHSLMRVDLNSPRHPKQYEREKTYTFDYFLGNSGNVIARLDYNNRTNELNLLVQTDNKWKSIYSAEKEIVDMDFEGLKPDLSSLVVLAESEKTHRTDYYTIALADGKISKTNWGRADSDIEGVLTDINRIAHGVYYSGFTPSYRMFDKKLDERVQSIVDLFPGHSVTLTSWSPDWKHMVFHVSGSRYVGAYFLFSEGQKPQFLANSRDGIDNKDVNPLASVTVKARDGLEIPTLLTIPQGNLNNLKNLPTIMLPHGGPEYYDRIQFDWIAQAFANEGYLVVQPQFRGSSGFGAEYARAGHGEWGRKMQDDITDALKALITKGIVNPDRVCIAGGSYGGYAALAGGAFTPELYKCVVSFNGVADIPAMLKDEKEEHGKDHWALSYWREVIANGDANKDFIKAISPSESVDKFTAPVLLLHGTKDKVVSEDQSKLMYKKLKKAKKNVTYIKLKDESHHLENEKTRVQFLQETVQFINKYIGK